ncbi:hypothetical protein SRB5_45650 [Streptomyces sp. RB5]|uniref:Potassium channel domain-containing protein n=1 Tax=Streptomyces smaragdinus TaxID=2585196 RepID=A0A7K0CLN2_9ACTN|nr:potassium channel family protein [Streptomyces smaragdinus]MQY14399.1 hypothetical protein [Streptomyces smaragdinus]
MSTRRGWAVAWAATAAVVTGLYFALPVGWFGPSHPAVSWSVFGVVLAVIAALLLHQIRGVMLDRPGSRPVLVIPLLMAATVLTFASAYQALSRAPGEFAGSLDTRVDAVYFTVVTLATVGYGDIVPTGQGARIATMLQIVYTFVFLTAGATALTQRLRRLAGARRPARPEGAEGRG